MLDNSLSWSEELARYCFIWLVYIGISYGVKKQRHIKVDVLLVLLKEKGRIVLTLIANVLFLIFGLFVIKHGYDIAAQLLAFGQQSPALHIPMGLVYMATPVGIGLTIIRLIQNMIVLVKSLLGKESSLAATEEEHLQESVNE
jgi:TRAP-type C4-dicarboxylate transport system permease small subunit